MNALIKCELMRMLSMQSDLLSDGEVPYPLSDLDYYTQMGINCEELSPAMAALLAKEMFESSDEFIRSEKLFKASIEHIGDYIRVLIKSANGEPEAEICYSNCDDKSYLAVMAGIHSIYTNKVLFV